MFQIFNARLVSLKRLIFPGIASTSKRQWTHVWSSGLGRRLGQKQQQLP